MANDHGLPPKSCSPMNLCPRRSAGTGREKMHGFLSIPVEVREQRIWLFVTSKLR